MQWWWAPLSALTAAVWFDSNHLGLKSHYSESQAPLSFEQVAMPVSLDHRELTDVSTTSENEQVHEDEAPAAADPLSTVACASWKSSEYREETGATIDIDNQQVKGDPLPRVANAIWQSMEFQNHVAIFTMEPVVAQLCSWIGVSMMPPQTTYPLDALLVNTSVVTFSEHVAAEFAKACGVALSMLPPGLESQYRSISDRVAMQVKQLLSEFEVEPRWRSMSEHAQIQAKKMLSAFQARFPQYRLDEGQPLSVLIFLVVWCALTLYLSSRVLFLSLFGLRIVFCFVVTVIKGVLCCPCRCICAQKRNRASSDGNSHNMNNDGAKEHNPSKHMKASSDANSHNMTNGGAKEPSPTKKKRKGAQPQQTAA